MFAFQPPRFSASCWIALWLAAPCCFAVASDPPFFERPFESVYSKELWEKGTAEMPAIRTPEKEIAIKSKWGSGFCGKRFWARGFFAESMAKGNRANATSKTSVLPLVPPTAADFEGWLDVWGWQNGGLEKSVSRPFSSSLDVTLLAGDLMLMKLGSAGAAQYPLTLARTSTGEVLHQWPELGEGAFRCVGCSANGRFAAVVGQTGYRAKDGHFQMAIFDANTRLLGAPFAVSGDDAEAVPSDDGRYVALANYVSGGGSQGGMIDVANKKVLWTRTPDGLTTVREVCFSMKGKTVTLTGSGLAVVELDVQTGREVSRWNATPDGKPLVVYPNVTGNHITMSPDEKYIAVTTAFDEAYVRSLKTGRTVRLVGGAAFGAVFSPSMDALATVDGQVIRIWPRRAWESEKKAGGK